MRSGFQRKKVERRKVVVRGEAKFRKLQEKVERQEKTIGAMRESLRTSEEGPVPEKCPVCGCTRFYRNGLVMMELERLLGVRLNGANRKIPVQKFICVNCGKGTHLEGPAALYHWVTGKGGQSRRKGMSKSIGRADVLFDT
jgi:predicted nucleic-acid-binding Zn-ribbon protein